MLKNWLKEVKGKKNHLGENRCLRIVTQEERNQVKVMHNIERDVDQDH